MNEIKATSDYKPDETASGMVGKTAEVKAAEGQSEFGSRRAKAKPKVQPKPEAPATPATKPASQRDIAELHKRMVQMFTTLNDGLTATALTKASKDREELCARLDETERAVNSMEGLLRIEFAPHIRTILQEEMDDHRRHQKRGWKGYILLFGLGAACVALGAVFSAELTETYGIILNYVLQLKDSILAG